VLLSDGHASAGHDEARGATLELHEATVELMRARGERGRHSGQGGHAGHGGDMPEVEKATESGPYLYRWWLLAGGRGRRHEVERRSVR
jgi:hypothetical protein